MSLLGKVVLTLALALYAQRIARIKGDMKGNCSFPFSPRGHLRLLPLVTGLLTLVENEI
jgi:hypothetical protein